MHQLGSDLNPYAFVFGSPQKLVDPTGLEVPGWATTTNAGTAGESYSSGSVSVGWTAGGAFQWCEEGGECGQTLEVPAHGESSSPPPAPKDWSAQDAIDLARQWQRFVLESEARASAEPKGWADSGKLVGKGAWNAVVSGVASGLKADPFGGERWDDFVSGGEEAISFTPPTTPIALTDYDAGYGTAMVAPLVVGALAAGVEVAGDAVAELFSEACFREGTLVTTCDGGTQPIETIRADDLVASWNEKTGGLECRRVAKTSVRVSRDLLDVELYASGSHDVVHTTAEHPFWVEGKGWTGARDLGLGDPVRVWGDGAGLVLVTGAVRQAGSAAVYNFEVEGTHSYFVGPAQALVHNACTTAPEGTPPPNMSPEGAGRQGAFNAAKRANDIPTSSQPSAVGPNLDRNGRPQPGRQYTFDNPRGGRDIVIRDDAAGHNYGPNNPQNRGPHFNDPAGNHYDY